MIPTGQAHSDSIGYLPGCCDKIPVELFQGGRVYSGLLPEDSFHSGVEDKTAGVLAGGSHYYHSQEA